TSRVSSRATKKFSELNRKATPTHSRAAASACAWPLTAARASRSSSRSNSNGLSRRGFRAASALMLSSRQSRLRLFDELFRRNRFHQIIDGSLAQTPDAVRFLILGRDHDNRDRLGLRIRCELARGLEAIDAGHDHIHQDEV